MQQSSGAADFRRGAGNTAQQSLPQPLLAAGSPRPQAAYFEAAPVCVRDTVIVERRNNAFSGNKDRLSGNFYTFRSGNFCVFSLRKLYGTAQATGRNLSGNRVG